LFFNQNRKIDDIWQHLAQILIIHIVINQHKMKQELQHELQHKLQHKLQQESLYSKVLRLVKAKTSLALQKKTQPKLNNTW
jgi:hypothetical protein